jgi:hypothetical protein
MRPLLALTTTLLLLGGCASGGSVSQNQCIASDWQTLGYRDGVSGYRSSRLLKHQDACVEHGIVPDRGGYMLGWEQGAREFCEPNNAFAMGERGAGHNNICPSDQRDTFLAAYAEGRTLYLARVEVANLEHKISQRQGRLEHLKSEIVASATDQLNPMLTPGERIELLAYTNRLRDEKLNLQHEMPSLHRELDSARAELNSLQRTLAGVIY